MKKQYTKPVIDLYEINNESLIAMSGDEPALVNDLEFDGEGE